MGDTAQAPAKVQAFPKQILKGLPKDGQVEITVVPKQVIEFQGISPEENQPKLTVTVDASGKSKLHYTPANCLAGTEACFETPGLHEMWIPQAQNPTSRFTISGFSTPHSFKIPGSFFDPANPMRIIMGEAPRSPILMDFPSKDGSFNTGYVPDGVDDFYIAMPDETRVLDGAFLKEGAHEIAGLSELQKTMLRSLIKEVVSAGGALYDDKDLLKDFGFNGKFYLKNQGGKTYVIFKGYSGLRSIFRGTRYSLDKNYSRFSILTIGKGPLKGAKMGVPKLTKGTTIGFLFMGLVNTWTWLTDDVEQRFLSDLLIELASDAIKAVIGGVLAAAAIGFTIMMTGMTAPVILVVAGTAIVAMFIGLGLDLLDEKIGVTDSVKKMGRKAEAGVKDMWEEYVSTPMLNFIQRCEWEIRNAYGVPGG